MPTLSSLLQFWNSFWDECKNYSISPLGRAQDVPKGNQLTVASLWSHFGGSSLLIKAFKCFLSFKHELKCFDEKNGLSHMLLSTPEERLCAFYYGKVNKLERSNNQSFCLEIVYKKPTWGRKEWELIACVVLQGSSSCYVLFSANQYDSEGNTQVLPFPRQLLMSVFHLDAFFKSWFSFPLLCGKTHTNYPWWWRIEKPSKVSSNTK